MKDNQITITIDHPKKTQIKREIMGLLHIFYNCSASGNNCVIKHPHITGGDSDDSTTDSIETTDDSTADSIETTDDSTTDSTETTDDKEEITQTGGGLFDFAEGILGDVKEEHEQSAGRVLNKIMPGSSYTPRKKTMKKTRFQ
jgi:hypothetical protein